MWNYEKRLQYPVNIKEPNPKMAQFIISQYGGLYRDNIYSLSLNVFVHPIRIIYASSLVTRIEMQHKKA